MKQVAVIVKDDVTELNKRLASGFQVSRDIVLAGGAILFILYKYETRSTNVEGGTLTIDSSSASLTSPSGFTYTTQTQG